jgi:uncharacterized damage-inducible protein DinB
MGEAEKIGEKLDVARSRLLAMAEDLDETQWNWQPGDGRWSVRLTLAHVGSAHWSHLEVARDLAAGAAVDLPGFELDAWNAARVAERADWSADQILADLAAAQRATAAFLAELDDAALNIRGTHPALGEVSVSQVLRIIGLHDNLHRRDVSALLQEIERAEPSPSDRRA